MKIYPHLRKILFKLEPETAHSLALTCLKISYQLGLMSWYAKHLPSRPRQLMGLEFANPVGLAAGFDKNAAYVEALSALGFGFIEVGTVTPRAQPGNRPPRLFRLPEAEALINCMGFNNDGIEAMLAKLSSIRLTCPLGINIGKNFNTPLEKAHEDYLYGMEYAYPQASYIVANISSPNTADLRSLQYQKSLQALLTDLKSKQREMNLRCARYVPLVVKIAPDLDEEQLKSISSAFLEHEVDGVIATNTTVRRDFPYLSSSQANLAGGLSGRPLKPLSLKIVQALSRQLQEKIPIIAVGGIMSAKDALDYLNAGASLLQVYTGLIYQGPSLIKEIIKQVP